MVNGDIYIGDSSTIDVNGMRITSERRFGQLHVQIRGSAGANVTGRVFVDGRDITELAMSGEDVDMDLE